MDNHRLAEPSGRTSSPRVLARLDQLIQPRLRNEVHRGSVLTLTENLREFPPLDPPLLLSVQTGKPLGGACPQVHRKSCAGIDGDKPRLAVVSVRLPSNPARNFRLTGLLLLCLAVGVEMQFKDLVTDSSKLMGVKAVYGQSIVSLVAFGSRGEFEKEPGKFFMLAHNAAEAALEAPYLISIGGGAQVPEQLRGRVLELMRVTGVYGKTLDFIPDEVTKARMQQWPVATILSEVYTISGEPRLVEDLGFPDLRILEHAYDTIRRNAEAIDNLWEAMRDRQIIRRHEIAPPPQFIDRGKLVHVGSIYPRVNAQSAEGLRIYETMLSIERDRALSKAKKEANRHEHGGRIVCECCDFADESSAMFDVHHLYPLRAGPRETYLEDLAVLCPTCHRWSHAKGADRLNPLPVRDVSAQMKARAGMSKTTSNPASASVS